MFFSYRKLRHAVEVRHDSFLEPLVHRYAEGAFCCCSVCAQWGRWPYMEDLTSDFMY